MAAHWDDLALLQLIGCITSVRRLRDFLLAEEVDPRFYERMLADEVCLLPPPPPPKWTRRVPHPVLMDTPRPSRRSACPPLQPPLLQVSDHCH